ncbi:surface protein related [Acinetobacter marinus]|uniref:Surface protein related n=1 Tax=Acinetobacter marinus TaxID=281375 RepID=A0A1G6PFK7_9GAMM|nr:YadA-like family protein [Acinetobacter marinus]SDC78135.1 surface protein related [Acinetobacter marinus]
MAIHGGFSNVTGESSGAIGNFNNISANNTYVIGNNIDATADNNVILGNTSSESSATTINGVATQVDSAIINNITYDNFAGTAAGVVSVGAEGAERQIINVAPGEISATSTDAINGSQLYEVANTLTAPLTFGADSGTDLQRALGSRLSINGDDNITTSTGADGLTISISDTPTFDSVTINNAPTNDTDATNKTYVDGSRTTVTSANNSVSVTQTTVGDALNFDLSVDAQSITDASQLPVVYTNDAGDQVYLQDDGSWNTVADGSGMTVDAGDIITSMQNADGTTTTPTVLTNVAAGDISDTSTDAVNGSQLYDTNQQVSTNTSNIATNTTNIANNAADIVTNANNITTNTTAINTLAATPLTFAGDSGGDVERELGTTLNVEGGATGTLTDGNIGVVANGTDTLAIQLAETIDLGSAGSVTTGNTVLNNAGVTITGGSNPVSLTSSGLDNGGNVISNVGAGQAGTDAVNVDQLTDAIDGVNTYDGWNLSTNGGTSEAIGENDTVDLSNTDGNISITQSGSNVEFGLADSITVGSTSPVTIDGDTGTIGGLTNTTFDANNYVSGQAATEDQLAGVADDVATNTTNISTNADNISTNTTNIATNTADIAKGINVGDGTTDNNYALGDTINITEADSNIETTTTSDGVEVGLADDISVTSVTAGNTVLNNAGVTINDGNTTVSLSSSGLDNGGNVISNVGAGQAGTDAVNVDQLNAAEAAAKTEVQEGQNIAVTSTTGSDGQTIYTVATDDEVEFDKVTVGDVVVDATTNDITGLSNTALGGADFAQSGRAATEEQLNETQDNLVTIIGGNAVNNGGVVTTTNIGGTGADNVNDAIQTVNTTAKAAKTEVEEGQNISVTSTTGSDGQTIYTVATDDDVNFNSVTIGDTAGDNTVLTSTADGLDVGGDKITNVAAGTISDSSTDAVNGSQLYGLSNNVTNLFGGNATYDGDVISWTNIGGTGENTIDDAIASIKDSADNANQGWNISTNGGTATNVKPADTVDFQGDGNVVVSNTGTEVTVGLADQVTIGTGDTAVSIDGDTGTITTGDVTIDGSTGSITAGQVTVNGDQGTVNGLSNTTWDADNITSGQAATEDQLQQVAADAASNAAKSKSTVSAGDNIEVTTSENTDGSTNYEVATAKDVTFDTVTSDTVTAGTVTADTVNVGDVSITSSGINAGNQKVTNVAAGTVSSDSTDAVNGSQLYGHAQAVQNIIGGSTTYNADTGTYTNNNIGGTGQSTIDAAIGAVNNNVTYLNQRVNDLEDDLSSGIAATAALENAPFIPGKWTYAAGASYYNDQSAIGATLRRTADNGRWSFTGGVAGGTNGSPIVRFGVSGVID